MHRRGQVIILVAFVAMFLLHQDVWWWTDDTLVLGFVPISMAYHIGFSIATAVLWWAAAKWAWPTRLEHWADEAGEDAAP